MRYQSCVFGFMIVALMAMIQFNSNSQETAGMVKTPVSYELKEISGRQVYSVHPEGKPPAKGWQVIILLHGRGQGGGAWFGEGLLSMGEQKTFPQEALRANYAILAPDSGETPRSGVRQWDCMHRVVERSEDLLFFRDLLSWVKKNDWARLDAGRVYVAGISSGGFMASRLAHAFPAQIRAVCIVSAGNADSVKIGRNLASIFDFSATQTISASHPPALILHGTADRLVPVDMGRRYFHDLQAAGVRVRYEEIPGGRHGWHAAFNKLILEWFSLAGEMPPTGGKSAAIVFMKSDSGKTVSLTQGEEFEIHLRGVPTAGYLWEIIDMDKKRVEILRKEESSLTPPGMAGGFALFTWRFRVIAPGECRLVLKYFRPWEGAKNALDTYTLHLNISK
jgi:poly(3-hydroxybutyrate) depolymerase/predicted secreted protein